MVALAAVLLSELTLVPVPLEFRLQPLTTTLGKVEVSARRGCEAQAAVLAEALDSLPVTRGRTKISLTLDSGMRVGEHRISIVNGGIAIQGKDSGAVANGCASVTQMAYAGGGEVAIGEVRDRPDVEFRGLLVDVARQWHSIETLKDIVTLCWLYKINYLQLHLTDDQSFTFPSEAFPLLPTQGRTYAKKDLAGLVEFARARGITIIPEIEMPGHGGQIVSKMPDLFQAHKLHHATLNFAKSEVRDALKKLILEVMEVFDSPYMHIGGDEADLAHVHEVPAFQTALKDKGLDHPQELFRDFINEMNGAVVQAGRKMIVWEGFAPGGKVPVSKDVVVQNFESAYYPPDRMAKDGYTLINASWKPLYVVNDRNWSPEEIYRWNYRRWEHFIEAFPSFRGIQLGPEAKVLGAMMCAWEQPQEREIPSLRLRLPAMSERLWRANTRIPYSDFARRVGKTDELLGHLLTPKVR